ncbi:Retrovirus-related Pol polyprotein from transposon 17.6 [Nosema granulosis]|uniref:Retrovirus-related Pol polyprotein from transposon 17.6 n=1 Tax=Nosema granulosis TaxID=83296 RepID=A0A9P6KYC0_9MICR|nr:Retrovirus-related Pol polyprotein from transposon 17.6 [Nosema granulosis]
MMSFHYLVKDLKVDSENYSVTDKEALAIVKSINNYRYYLLGKEFVLRTDHKALVYLWESKPPTSRLLRWSMLLQEYKFRISYIKGKDNVADGCKGIFCKEERISAIFKEFSEEEKYKILRSYHKETGHGSANNMKFVIKGRYYWPGFYKDIYKLILECEFCAKAGYKICNTKNRVIETKDHNELWEIDLKGRILHDGQNYFIILAVDHL